MDFLTKKQRSLNMSRVKSKNTKPEILIFSLLKKAGYKFRRHYRITGKPDVAFLEHKVAVFVDGEFWHGKDFNNLKDKLSPFWKRKIGNNLKRDRLINKLLKLSGWEIIRLWDKEILKQPNQSIKKIIILLNKVKATEKD